MPPHLRVRGGGEVPPFPPSSYAYADNCGFLTPTFRATSTSHVACLVSTWFSPLTVYAMETHNESQETPTILHYCTSEVHCNHELVASYTFIGEHSRTGSREVIHCNSNNMQTFTIEDFL